MCSCACIDDPIFFRLCNAMIDEKDALQEDQETLIQYNFISQLTFIILFLNFYPCNYMCMYFFFVNRQIHYMSFCLQDPLLHGYHFLHKLIVNIGIFSLQAMLGIGRGIQELLVILSVIQLDCLLLNLLKKIDQNLDLVHDCRMYNDPELRSFAQDEGHIIIKSFNIYGIYFQFIQIEFKFEKTIMINSLCLICIVSF